MYANAFHCLECPILFLSYCVGVVSGCCRAVVGDAQAVLLYVLRYIPSRGVTRDGCVIISYYGLTEKYMQLPGASLNAESSAMASLT